MGNICNSNSLWTRIILDEKLKVLEIVNPDDMLFFGRRLVLSKGLTEVADARCVDRMQSIEGELSRVIQERRSCSFDYVSSDVDGTDFTVCAHVELREEGRLRLSVASLEAKHTDNSADMQKRIESSTALDAIFESLPVGVEIYDRDGRLLNVNKQELDMLGIVDKNEMLGIDLFANPHLSADMVDQLRAGENLNLSLEYDFRKLEGYCRTTRRSIRYLEVAIAAMRDADGEIDKYLIISNDVTDRVLLRKKYEELYRQNAVILDSLPVGVALYSRDGVLRYANQSCGRIFGADEQNLTNKLLNINDNHSIPDAVKLAIQQGAPLQMRFPYDFSYVSASKRYKTSRNETRQIESNGQPIFDTDGVYENYVYILNDVTEEAQREEALRQSQRKVEIAMQASDIMLWEFDVDKRVFFSENEPMNHYDYSTPIPIERYIETIHPEDYPMLGEMMTKMQAGEEVSFCLDVRVLLPENPEWQYCTVSGSPYEKDETGRVVRFVGSRKNNSELYKRKLLQDRILNSIPVSIHIKDVVNDFRYVFCNDESRRLFGTSTEKTAYDVMDDHEVLRIRRTDLEVFNSGDPYVGEERVVLKDGRSYDTIVNKSVIYDDGQRLLLTIRWDQSHQNDLQRRAKVLSITMEAMKAYMWIFEPDRDRVTFGEGFDKACAHPDKVYSLETFADRVHPEDRERFLVTIQTLLHGKEGVWDVEYRADLDYDGECEWWQTRGTLETRIFDGVPYRYVFGMTISINAHKQSELILLQNKEELASLNRQNELVLNNTNSGLAYISADYVVQWENISFCSASLSYEAYKQGEVCYKSAHNRTSPCENCVLQRAMASCQVEQIKFTLDNNHVVEIFATPVLGKDESIEGIVIRVDDITERERMIEELRKAKALAEQSDKLKSAFLANMSHEIRTPLNAIVGFSELLMNSEAEEKDEYMRIIHNNNDLLLKLINDILDLSKIEAGSVELKYEEFDLSEYFNEMAVAMKRRVTNSNVRLMEVNPYPVCRVNLDRNRVAQILTNYVTNSIKYTPKGFIEMGYERTDVGVRLYVKDSGIGISDEKKVKVFHRFEKLDEFAQGTGLGLSICKAIAESMGGSVGFESKYGEGSTFWADLPCEILVESHVADTATPPLDEQMSQVAVASTHPSIEGRPTILIAEDIPSNYLLLSAILSRRFDLLHAVNGQLAIDFMHTHHVDVVLMDMKMPVKNGLEATAEIRTFNTQIPIIALTAHAFESDRVKAMELGCNDYLVKPIDKPKLMAVLRKYCPSAFEEDSK